MSPHLLDSPATISRNFSISARSSGPMDPSARSDHAQHHLGEGVDGRQGIVDLVDGAGHQLSQGDHLVFVDEPGQVSFEGPGLLFQLLFQFVGDVPENLQDQLHGPLAVFEGHRGDFAIANGLVAVVVLVDGMTRSARLEAFVQRTVKTVLGAGGERAVGDLVTEGADHIILAHARPFQERVVGVQNLSIGLHDEHPVADAGKMLSAIPSMSPAAAPGKDTPPGTG